MVFTYVLKSEYSNHWYVGVTSNARRRLAEHNAGKSVYTQKFRPWKLRMCVTFQMREKAEKFERYLKSHSGRAFMKKHF